MNVTFLGGKTYGVDDLNDAVAKLVGVGVAPFTSKDSYNYEDLNSLTASITEEGTSLDGLKVTAADGIVTISEGIAYFENGITVEITEPKQIEYVSNTAYVFFKYDVSLHLATIEVSETDYDKDDTYNYYIPLALVNGSVVTDRRSYARSKIATFGTNITQERRFKLLDESVSVFIPVISHTKSGAKLTDLWYTREEMMENGYAESDIVNASIVATIEDIDISKYNYITFVQTEGDTDTSDKDYAVGIYNLRNDCFLYNGSYWNTNTAKKAGYYFYVKLVNGRLTAIFRNKYSGNNSYADYKKYVPYIKLIFS